MASIYYPLSSANLFTAETAMTFNRNDAVDLFKNEDLIDITGTFNGGTTNFAADQTIRRKSSVTSPSTNYNKTTQWNSYTFDTCNNLGRRMAENVPKTNSALNINDIALHPMELSLSIIRIKYMLSKFILLLVRKFSA